MHNKAEAVWQKIISELGRNTQEIKTIDNTGRSDKGRWFSVSVKDGILYVGEANLNKPSSTLAMERPIPQKEFSALYPNYSKWRAGTMPREKAKGSSMNSSYIFALIHAFDDVRI